MVVKMDVKVQGKVNEVYTKMLGVNRLSKKELAFVFRSEMDRLKMGTESYSKFTGIPRTSIRNTLLFLKVSDSEANSHHRGGITIKQLRNKYLGHSEDVSKVFTELDFQLKETLEMVSKCCNNGVDFGEHTLGIVDALVKELNRYMFRINKKNGMK